MGRMGAGAPALLLSYLEAHNEGVRTHDYSRLVGLLHKNAIMEFEGLKAGPFIGADAIHRAFEVDGPSDELYLGAPKVEGPWVEAPYGWVGSEEGYAGTLRIEARKGKIRQIRVLVATR